jgi:hypothetical protein
MSGRKRILVAEADWLKLQRKASRLGEIRREMRKLVKEVRRQTEEDLERIFSQVEDRQRQIDQTVAQLSEQARQLEASTNRRLHEHAERMQESLRATAGQLREETRNLLAEQERAWRSEIDEIRQERTRAAGTARQWLDDAHLMHDLIRDTLPHERFAPGQLTDLHRRLATAEGNLVELGAPEAALARAQDVYHSLSELRLELELRDREWRALQSAATEALTIVDSLIDHNKVLAVRDPEGQEIPGVELNVDYWSGGALTRLRADVAAILQRVGDETEPMSTTELEAVIEREAPELEQRLVDVVDRAGRRQLASQVRVNLADLVAQTLDETAGYQLVDNSYAANDEREPFYVKLRQVNGNEIVVEVAPESEDSGRSILRMFSFDQDTASLTERRQRSLVVARNLRENGIPVDEPETEEGEPDIGLRDLESIRRSVPRSVATESPG